jgi:CRP-like cAMP-binding protein
MASQAFPYFSDFEPQIYVFLHETVITMQRFDKAMNPSKYLEEGLGVIFDPNIAGMIDDAVSLANFPGGQIILLEGERSENLYFIIRGIVRGYYIDSNGNDITKCFCSENEFFSSEGLRTAGVSSFTLECLEDCRCIRLPYEFVRRLMKEDGRIKDLFITNYLKEMEKLEKRARIFAMMGAEERYRDFCKQFRRLHDRVELKYVASYIGIRPASLSRIRKKPSLL